MVYFESSKFAASWVLWEFPTRLPLPSVGSALDSLKHLISFILDPHLVTEIRHMFKNKALIS